MHSPIRVIYVCAAYWKYKGPPETDLLQQLATGKEEPHMELKNDPQVSDRALVDTDIHDDGYSLTQALFWDYIHSLSFSVE